MVLTLWGDSVDQAAELEGGEMSILIQCTSCRVGEYAGGSLGWVGCAPAGQGQVG